MSGFSGFFGASDGFGRLGSKFYRIDNIVYYVYNNFMLMNELIRC